jgi:hypothetical protein
MGRIQAFSVEAWLLSSLALQKWRIRARLCPLENIVVRRKGDVMTLFNLSL